VRITKHSFSAIQGRLLSKLAPSTISFPAFSTSALSSTITGGFPAPAPMAFYLMTKVLLQLQVRLLQQAF
jgi:hypothetical protein